jgi:pimeloyl-ACP methyl ester carboxylesterase
MKHPRTRGAANALSMGMYLTVMCSESLVVITDEEIVRETSDTFLGDYRTRRHQQAGREWPQGKIPAEYYQPVKSDVPVLMLSDRFDPATPPRFGRDAAQSPPNSRQVLVTNIAHGYGSECTRNLIAEFISKVSVQRLDTSCIETLRPPSFVKELPRRYRR